jgi:L-ascorbate metabolism protein UlaG (beta-lactamase superfamily)
MSAVSTLVGGVHRGVEDADVAGTGNAEVAIAVASDVATDEGERRRATETSFEHELERMHRDLEVRRYRSLTLHWLTRWFRAPRPVTPDPLTPVRPGEVAITFVGHASALLRYHDLSVAFDPMLGDWVGGVRRAVAPGLAPADLREVQLVLISHRHIDHLHPPTLAALPRRATVVVPVGAAAAVSRFGFDRVIELRPGVDLEFRGLQIGTFPIRHGNDELAAGLSYLLQGRGPSVFLCGDSGYHSGFTAIGQRFAPDIALLPIGGFWPRSFRERHMSPLDALAAFKDLTARALVPIHHGSFVLSYEKLDEPIRILLELATQQRVRDYIVAMEPGQTDTFALDASASDPTRRMAPILADLRMYSTPPEPREPPGEDLVDTKVHDRRHGPGSGRGSGPLMTRRR